MKEFRGSILEAMLSPPLSLKYAVPLIVSVIVSLVILLEIEGLVEIFFDARTSMFDRFADDKPGLVSRSDGFRYTRARQGRSDGAARRTGDFSERQKTSSSSLEYVYRSTEQLE